ncbi:MAG: potassium/proton antiporter [Solirubrobacteraceae bacterium]|nr:potassium/proton antiporter [Solirubrobacteraceae bacterium]
MEHSQSILIAGVLLALAIATTLVARRARVPGLVLFLVLGVVVGPDVLGVVNFVSLDMAQTVGVVALALILFEGGLASGWKEIQPVFGVSLSLATIGTLLTAVITGLGTAYFLDYSTLQAMLIGGIVASTDGAAVFALLRGSTLKKRLARTLEAEAGLNDPVAILLVIGFIDWITLPSYGVLDMVKLFVEEMAVGAAVGIVVGFIGVRGIRAVGNVTSGLYPVATVATAATAFGLAQVLHGSGFLAVFIAGLILGSARLPAKRAISDFHDGIAWVGQIAVFLVLGLLFAPSSLKSLWDEALIVTLLLMFVARPVAVFVATLFAKFEFREVALLQWAGMRGAVPIVLATFPLVDGIADSNAIYNIVFFVVLASAIFQGTTFEYFATRLGLTTTERAIVPPVIQAGNIRKLGAEFFEFPIKEGDAIAGHVVRELQLPREALVSVIVRGDEALLPRGSTELEVGDRLQILVRGYLVKRIEELFELWRVGPIGEEEREYVRPIAGRSAIFSVKPWEADAGDQGDPQEIGGRAVIRRVRIRHDAPGSLVVLADGRFAAASSGVVAVGSPGQIRSFAARRIEASSSRSERAWWQEVAGAVA